MTRQQPTREMRRFAGLLVAREMKRDVSRQEPTVAVLVYERLRPVLAALLGHVGFNALLLRALTLASTDVTWLAALSLGPDGALQGLEEAEAPVGAAAKLRGGVALLSELLVLLVAFIGEDLTMRLVREVWPDVAFGNLDLGKGTQK